MISFSWGLKRMIGNLMMHFQPAIRLPTALACRVVSILDFFGYCMPTRSSETSVIRPKKSLWAILSHPCAIASSRTEKAYFYHGAFVLEYVLALKTCLCRPTTMSRRIVSPYLTNPITALRTIYAAGYSWLKQVTTLGAYSSCEILSLLIRCFPSTTGGTNLPSIPRCSMIPAIGPKFCATDVTNLSFFRQNIMRCSHISSIA